MAEERVQRRLAAIISADVVGYSRMMGQDEAGTLAQLKSLRSEFLHPKIAEYGGRIVKTTGDGTLIEFGSAVDAVSHAVDVQRGMAVRNSGLPDDRQIRLRLGINLGDIIIDGDDIFGDGVNVAARLEALAEPGGICVSGTVYEHVRDKLDAKFDDLGDQQVKNIDRPVRCYRVQLGPADERAKPARPRPDKPSIAVLPFNNMSGDPEQEYFADGMTEDLITDLSKISGLFVVARHSSFAFKGRSADVREVSGKLGVAHVLEGSVRKMGSRVRINAQLVDGKSGGHLWAERFDGDFEDIFSLQDEIMARIVSALQLHLTAADRESAERRPTQSVEAYELCLKGRSEYYRYTPENLANAKRYLEEAIRIDPNYAEAYGYLSYCHTTQFSFTWPGADESLEPALALAEKALALDDRSSVAHTRLGWILGFLGRFDEARSNFEKAISLDPRNAEAHFAYAETMTRAGEPEMALRLMEKGFAIETVTPPSWDFMRAHAFVVLGRFDEALAILLQVIDRVPHFVPARVQLAVLYVEMDRIDDATGTVEVIRNLAPSYTIRSAERMFNYVDERHRRSLRDSLRKAGLPE